MKTDSSCRRRLSTPAYSRPSGGTSTEKYAGTLTSKTCSRAGGGQFAWETLYNSTHHSQHPSLHCICFIVCRFTIERLTSLLFLYHGLSSYALHGDWHWFVPCRVPSTVTIQPQKPLLIWWEKSFGIYYCQLSHVILYNLFIPFCDVIN